MQLIEVIGVLEYIDSFFRKHNLPNQYKRLTTALNQARKKPSPEITTKIIQQKERIRTSHEAMVPEKLSLSNQKLFEKLGAAELIGESAMAHIDQIFQTHEADLNSVAQALGELAEQTSELMERVRSLLEGLNPLTEEETIASTNGTTLRLLFPENTSATTIQELEDSLQKWGRVLGAFSRLTRQPEEDSIITDIEQEPFTIELAVPDGATSAISRATCAVLGDYEKYLNIKRIGLEVSTLELRNKGIADQIDNEAQILIRNTATQVTKSLMDEFEWKKESDRNEVHNLTNTAVATIFQFVKDRGRIAIHEAGKPTSQDQKQLTDAFYQVQAIEAQIEQLDRSEDHENHLF